MSRVLIDTVVSFSKITRTYDLGKLGNVSLGAREKRPNRCSLHAKLECSVAYLSDLNRSGIWNLSVTLISDSVCSHNSLSEK